jgi:hypothetical protein
MVTSVKGNLKGFPGTFSLYEDVTDKGANSIHPPPIEIRNNVQ